MRRDHGNAGIGHSLGVGAGGDDGKGPLGDALFEHGHGERQTLTAKLGGDSERVIAEAGTRDAAGRHAESLALITRAQVAAPADYALQIARASTLFAWGRFREARDVLLRAHAAGLRNETLNFKLGWSHLALGAAREAEEWMRKAVMAEPNGKEFQHGLTVALMAQRRMAEAIAICDRALERNPEELQFSVCLGQCKLDQRDLAGAERHFRHALATDGNRAAIWILLGKSLRLQRRRTEALEAFELSERLATKHGEDLDSFVDVATEYLVEGRTQDALDVLESNLARRPALEGYRAYAEALLTAGKLVEGWCHYEVRWMLEPLLSSRSQTQRPRWSGQQLHGKTLLLRYEQGYGDTIQFLRYAPTLQTLGATVLLGKFSNLAYSFPGVDRVLDYDGRASEFDYYIDLVSLPKVFATGISSIPVNIPYLSPAPEKAAQWATRLRIRGVLSIGLAWAGNPAHPRDSDRSIALAMLAPLLSVAGARFFFLQKGEAAREAEAAPSGLEVVNLGPELEDFCDTAAVISQLDLVICVDTAVAHLAGALGKPVWVLLPRPADWRWLEGREDSPWYPTMRLFRQIRRGEWEEVIERVKVALQERLRDGVSVTVPGAHRGPQVMPAAQPPVVALPSQAPGHRPGFSAVAECRYGILQYLPDEAWVGDSLGWYGEYLQPQLDLLARLIRAGATVLEVGAGVGEQALFLAATIGAGGHLFLYESRPVVRRILQQNLGANRITNVTLMRRTLGATGEAADRSSETLDELQLERLDWLKVNSSVSALDVLDGGSDTLWRLRPLLFLAAADDAALSALALRVKELGYRCWRTETALFNPDNFNRRDTDIFSGRSALALLAIPEEIDVDIALDGCVELS